MKILFSAAALFLSIILLSSCKGDAGPAGPAGPAGATGPTGATGATGATGSANVTQYSFAGFTHTGVEISRDFNLSQTDFEKSIVYTYVKTAGNFWYPLPGSVTSAYEYRTYFSNPNATTTRVYLNRLTGAGDQAFTALRIVVIPAATLINVRSSIDFKNYLQVAQTFGLPLY